MQSTQPSEASLATGQRSLVDYDAVRPLVPPVTGGCPETSVGGAPAPLEVTYEYDAVALSLFESPLEHGLDRWAPLLPPLSAPGIGEGNTPLIDCSELAAAIDLDADLYVKDESANPTWSQKDRLARTTVSGAIAADARGIVVSSTGNHGAATAAYAARAGLDAIVLTAPRTPGAVTRFCRAYGAAVIAVDDIAARHAAIDRLADHGFHPVSSCTDVHTGHPYGPEGYKTIAYELYRQLDGQVPGSLFVPTCYSELLYGVWKGFRELSELGVADDTPQLYACEPAARAPLALAIDRGEPIVSVDAQPTEAYSIKATTSSYRGYRALADSDGDAAPFSEGTLEQARHDLAEFGLWQEDSGAAGIAGLYDAVDEGIRPEGPIVCIATSSGFKNGRTHEPPQVDAEWPAIRACIEDGFEIDLSEKP